ncbi:hypothetical protein [Hufsiella ginkgonis]|uniref:Uncharacterized protein n=1 Tax=Hufsiella ginkgonis TaxID=2695274 RepID=A0A7K1XTT5_9SPHI|nr:hypothetical protein [Hufsiella ginkgonis]MXV14415.1 hypothetical protein [Hufsiella ginkgonis]
MVTLNNHSFMTVEEQLEVLEAGYRKVTVSPEAALEFLKSSGLLELSEQSRRYDEIEAARQKKKHKTS